MTAYCKEMVWHGMTETRCRNRVRRDGYCDTHLGVNEANYKEADFNRRAGDRCRELGIEPEEIKA